MKSNDYFKVSGVTSVISYFGFLCKKKKRDLEFREIYYLDNGELAIRDNSRARNLYIERCGTWHKSIKYCENSFNEMLICLYAYVISTEHQDEVYGFSQLPESFSNLFREYQKKTIRAFKELETFREFKFDSTLKNEIYSLELGEIKTKDKMEELYKRFSKELFDQE